MMIFLSLKDLIFKKPVFNTFRKIKMKILAFGDIHGDKKLAQNLSEKALAEKVDLVLLCGDLSNFDSYYSGIISQFVNKNIKFAFVRGNHDSEATAEMLLKTYNLKNIDGDFMLYYNIGFIGVGGANVGPFPVSEKEILSKIEQGFKKLIEESEKTKITLEKIVFVSHVHPSGTLMEKFTNFLQGSKALREAITHYQPDLLLCSHVHEAGGIEEIVEKTRVINVGREGKIIEL